MELWARPWIFRSGILGYTWDLGNIFRKRRTPMAFTGTGFNCQDMGLYIGQQGPYFCLGKTSNEFLIGSFVDEII